MEARTMPASCFPRGTGCNLTQGGPTSTFFGGVGKVTPAPVLVPGLGFPYLLPELGTLPCTQLAVASGKGGDVASFLGS